MGSDRGTALGCCQRMFIIFLKSNKMTSCFQAMLPMETSHFSSLFTFERVDCHPWLVKFLSAMIKKLMIHEMCLKTE